MVFVPALIIGVLCTGKVVLAGRRSPQPIDSFVLSLHSLETQHARKVRVLHFGDSHIASDNESSVVRSYLQNRFGDGGPGLGLPWGGPRLSTLNYHLWEHLRLAALSSFLQQPRGRHRPVIELH